MTIRKLTGISCKGNQFVDIFLKTFKNTQLNSIVTQQHLTVIYYQYAKTLKKNDIVFNACFKQLLSLNAKGRWVIKS